MKENVSILGDNDIGCKADGDNATSSCPPAQHPRILNDQQLADPATSQRVSS